MHIVYKLTFNKRKKRNIMPFLYIGSKSNVSMENGIIYDRRGKEYYGSSTYENYSGIVESDDIEVEIIREFDEYVDALNFESMIQKSFDVVADPRYFNLAIATVNSYTDPNYATYKHTITGKTVRLPREHPMVISGIYVGVSKGTILTEEQRKRRGRSGEENAFFGKRHTEETIEKILSSRNQTYEGNPELFQNVRQKMSETAKKTFSGVPKTEEQKKKMGRKGMIVLKNKDTGETIRIYKSEKENYDLDLWINPYILSENKSTGSKWTTNGIENKKIRKGEEPQQGFWFGRTNAFKSKKETK
jgi:hypothetical protein